MLLRIVDWILHLEVSSYITNHERVEKDTDENHDAHQGQLNVGVSRSTVAISNGQYRLHHEI